MTGTAEAEAIKIAYERLKSRGYGFTMSDVGYNAALILKAMKKEMEQQ